MAIPTSGNGVNGINSVHPRNGDSRLSNSPQPSSFLDADSANDELAKILRATDQVRALGIGREFDLPQIIVCGSQSSGKSSVLEAITHIPFPRSEKTCTRFVTLVRLVRARTDSIRARIEPDPARPAADAERLREFKRSTGKSDVDRQAMLASFIQEADAAIFSDEGSAADWLVTDDVLVITISGPGKQPLQLLDLPGLIAFHQKHSGKEEGIEKIVKRYMAMPQSIMLAVVKATDDLNNGRILGLCREYDPAGVRTIGILTRPDVTEASQALHLIQVVGSSDPEFCFTHSWHVLRNRNTQELRDHTAPAERDRVEESFFDCEPWNAVAPDARGIDSLRTRIRDLLLEVNKRELPVLRQKLVDRQRRLHDELAALGGEEDDLKPEELRARFAAAMTRLRDAARDHARGVYESDIRNVTATDPMWLRSRIVEQSEVFYDRMAQSGHAWDSHIRPQAVDCDTDLGSIFKTGPDADADANRPSGGTRKKEARTRDEEVEDGVRMLNLKRGTQLPGTHDPHRINDLFWRMSEDWHHLASRHVENVVAACAAYFNSVTAMKLARAGGGGGGGFSNARTVADRLIVRYITPRLRVCRAEALAELDRLEEDRRDFCLNFDPAFLKQSRAHRTRDDMRRALQARPTAAAKEGGPSQELGPATYAKATGRFSRHDQDREVAESHADMNLSVYESALSHFVDNVLKQVVERHFLRKIGDTIPDNVDLATIRKLTLEDDEAGRQKAQLRIEAQKLDGAVAALEAF